MTAHSREERADERDTRADERDARADVRDAAPAVIPADVARQANRGIFYRYLSILAVLGLGLVGYLGYHSVQATEDPCSVNLHGLECQARTCVRLNDAHFKLTPYCDLLLDKVRRGQQPLGPGAKSAAGDVSRHDLVQVGGTGGGATTKPTGSSHPGPAAAGSSGGSAPVDVHLPNVGVPGVTTLPSVPPVCTGVVNVNC